MIRLACVGAVTATLLMTAPPAYAIAPPVADPSAVPRDAAPSGSVVTQVAGCSTTTLLPGTPQSGKPTPDLVESWRFSRGEGQTVAIIDTGVHPSPRLRVDPGGDYIQSTDGLTDCDGHGTFVAGIIGAQPAADGFSGVAPAARLVSIRQASTKFSPRTTGGDPAIESVTHAVDTLARAVVHAADLGARVINISVVTCLPATKTVDQAALGAALRYAAIDKDAVIVAAAGNAGGSEPNCQPNPLSGPGQDPRNWGAVESISIPSWWQPYVLAVGSVAADGSPSRFTMPGPWVGAAAPGENAVSLSNGTDAGLANGTMTRDGKPAPISGTSYSAAYVSGVAALVRSRFPELKSGQVISRLQETARNPGRSPSNLVGAGTVDPVAALTWEVGADGSATAPAVRSVTPPPAPAAENPLPRRIAFLGAGICAIAVVLVAAASARRRQESTK